ncbi:ferredoxin [Actinopolymorpha sp. B9G3]|uniref:ferredoxin n=1 Tax=Actinopolymorpha sp. B9G3 TaxID=3158970 RepID=UPI0032D8F03E
MRIVVDRERCASAGMCALTVPDVFDQDEGDGRVILLMPEPPAFHEDAARRAVALCPSGAITIAAGDDGSDRAGDDGSDRGGDRGDDRGDDDGS